LQLFVFFPLIVAVLQGQDSILLLLGFCLAYRALNAGRPFAAGFLISLLLFKFQIALPVGVLLAVRFGLPILAGLLAGSALMTALSIAATGWQVFLSYGRALTLTGSATLASNSPNGVLGVVPSAMPNLKGLISGVTFGFASGKTILLVTLGLSVLATMWIVGKLRAQRPPSALAFSWAVAGGLLLSYYLHLQDLTVMQLPLGLTASEKNSNVARASWLFYVAPPFAAILGHGAMCLLSLLFLLFLYGLAQMFGQSFRAANQAAASIGG
jgi:hypothetical protein